MAETVDDLIDALIGLSQLRADSGTNDDGFWGIALNQFAADVVNRVLPDDPIAQQAVIRKAQALGIDIGGEEREPRKADNVVDLTGRLRGDP